MPSVKAFALLMAGLAAAGPMQHRPRNIIARQDATTTGDGTTTTAGDVAAAEDTDGASSTSSSSTSGASPSITGLPAEPVAALGMVEATDPAGSTRTCSLSTVSSLHTTYITTLSWTTMTEYTISYPATIGCQCDDGWGAGIGTSIGDDGQFTLTCQFGDDQWTQPVSTQTSNLVPNPTFVAEWCETIDADDTDKLIDIWENKNVSAVLDKYTLGAEDDWLQNLVEKALPNSGNIGAGSCGVIGSECNLKLNCADMVEKGLGAEYWILSAVEGFHKKLGVAHEFLQDTTIDNILSLGTISDDFSAPQSTGMNALDILAPLLSAGIFLGGSVTGVVGVIASEARIAAKAAAASATASAKAAARAAKSARHPGADKMAAQAVIAQKAEDKLAGSTDNAARITGALGAGLWTTASCFTMIGAFSDPEGQIEESDLEPVLQQMFSSARDQIEALGARALGRGDKDFEALPATNGSGRAPPLSPESYIAGFFSDGKFLLSESNEFFNQSIRDSYGTFKSKIVDQALQTGGLQVFALTDLDNEEECKDEDLWGGYGAEWMDPLGDGTNYCMQLYRDNHGSGCGGLTTCDWVVPEKEVFDKLKDNYGFNMQAYYSAAAQCNKAGLEDNIPDYTKLQSDGVTPACYYNIKAQKAKKYNNCHGRDGLLCDSGFSFSDF